MFSNASIILKEKNMLKMQLMYNDLYLPILKVNLKKQKKKSICNQSQLAWPTKPSDMQKNINIHFFLWISYLQKCIKTI